MVRPMDVVFDSRTADNGNRDEPSFNMMPSIDNVKGMSLVWSNIPFTWIVCDEVITLTPWNIPII